MNGKMLRKVFSFATALTLLCGALSIQAFAETPVYSIEPSPAGSYPEYYLLGVLPNTTAGQLLEDTNYPYYSVFVNDSNGNGIPDSTIVATGYQISLVTDGYHGFNLASIIIAGDVNGDGAITALDLTRMQKQVLEGNYLTGPYLRAADVNNDGAVDAVDIMLVRKYMSDGHW